MSELIHPTEFMDQVLRRRGQPSGPRADVYVPQEDVPPGEEQVLQRETVAPVELPMADHVRSGLRECYFMGSQVLLNEGELAEMKQLLGRALVRQLEQEMGRIRQATGITPVAASAGKGRKP